MKKIKIPFSVWSLHCLICCLCIQAAVWSFVLLALTTAPQERDTVGQKWTLPALPHPFPGSVFKEAVKSDIMLAPVLSTIQNIFLVRTECQRWQSWYSLQVALPVAEGVSRGADPGSGYFIASFFSSIAERDVCPHFSFEQSVTH